MMVAEVVRATGWTDEYILLRLPLKRLFLLHESFLAAQKAELQISTTLMMDAVASGMGSKEAFERLADFLGVEVQGRTEI